MRFRIVVAAYALWLMAVFGVFYAVHGDNENALQLAVIGGVIPAVCQIFLLGIDWRGLVAPVKLWLVLLLVILLSYFANGLNPETAPSGDGTVIPAAWTPLVYTVNAAFILGIATLIAGSPDRRLLQSIAALFCILSAPFLLYVNITGERVWGRLSANDLQPNVWGLAGLTVCLAAFARKPGILTVASFIIGIATILEASSRENLLSLAVAALFVLALQIKAMKGTRLFYGLIASCVALLAAALLFDPYILDAINYFNANVLLLNSPNRGLDSGFSGRSEVWTATIELWLKSPIIGIGFRQHEQFLQGWPAHNAYLAMLADCGVIGLVVYLVLLVKSFFGSFGIEEQGTRRFVLAVIVAYIVSGFFDRRTINGGNPYSLFFLMCCSVALADHSWRRVAALYRRTFGETKRATLAADPPLPAR